MIIQFDICAFVDVSDASGLSVRQIRLLVRLLVLNRTTPRLLPRYTAGLRAAEKRTKGLCNLLVWVLVTGSLSVFILMHLS